jgi:hypothetical protein
MAVRVCLTALLSSGLSASPALKALSTWPALFWASFALTTVSLYSTFALALRSADFALALLSAAVNSPRATSSCSAALSLTSPVLLTISFRVCLPLLGAVKMPAK